MFVLPSKSVSFCITMLRNDIKCNFCHLHFLHLADFPTLGAAKAIQRVSIVSVPYEC